MSKKTFLVFIIISLFFSNSTVAQRERSYMSSFYSKPIEPVSDILFLYRTELYKSPKALENFKNTLKAKCEAHNVTANFAILGSDLAESLRTIAGFICKITFVMDKRGSVLTMPTTRIISKTVSSKGDKNIFIFGYKDLNVETPIWKCSCNVSATTTSTTDEESAVCVYQRLLHDGIIK